MRTCKHWCFWKHMRFRKENKISINNFQLWCQDVELRLVSNSSIFTLYNYWMLRYGYNWSWSWERRQIYTEKSLWWNWIWSVLSLTNCCKQCICSNFDFLPHIFMQINQATTEEWDVADLDKPSFTQPTYFSRRFIDNHTLAITPCNFTNCPSYL